MVRDLYFKDELNGLGVGWSSYIYKTTNGGLNWEFFPIAPSGDFNRVSFINENIGFTASSRAVYKTTNFGISWDSVGNIPAIVYSISFKSSNVGYAGTAYNILNTTNGGLDWNTQVSTGVVYKIFSVNDSLVWTCGNGGMIWHTTNGGLSVIQNTSDKIPADFILFQNYPNPFNNQTRIRFHINRKSNYKLEVFSNLGTRVQQILNQNINPEEYEILYDASSLSSGIYYYKLSDNNFTETKKLILIK